MTKRDIVQNVAERLGLPQARAKVVVQATLDAMLETILRTRRLELRNFGVFEVRIRKARTARNPRTGEPVKVPERLTVSFKPGKLLEQSLHEENIKKKVRKQLKSRTR